MAAQLCVSQTTWPGTRHGCVTERTRHDGQHRGLLRHPRPDIRRPLADVKKAYRKLARQHHPDRNNADPGAIDRFRRITEAYEYRSAHLKDSAHGNGSSRPGPTALPRADAGMPGGDSESASRVLIMLEETWQAIRARHPEIPPFVIIVTSSTTGRDAGLPPAGGHAARRLRSRTTTRS
jgi:curved DNA-binding protein CbpA